MCSMTLVQLLLLIKRTVIVKTVKIGRAIYFRYAVYATIETEFFAWERFLGIFVFPVPIKTRAASLEL